MTISQRKQKKSERFLTVQGNRRGFTIIELMVGMVVGAFVATFILGSYIHIAKMATNERQQAMMQINQRGSIEELESGVRMAGYNPEECLSTVCNFGVRDVRQYTITNEFTAPAPCAVGSTPSILCSPTLTLFSDGLTAPNPNGVVDAGDTFTSYRLFDENNDGRISLARDQTNGLLDWTANISVVPREVLAENIRAIAFAYSYDTTGDRRPERTTAGNVIWAIDQNNDNFLDFNLDTNDDGFITTADDTNGDRIIDGADNGGAGILAATVDIVDIIAIKVFILAQADSPSDDYANTNQYVVGNIIWTAGNGNFQFNEQLECLLMVRSIERRNLP